MPVVSPLKVGVRKLILPGSGMTIYIYINYFFIVKIISQKTIFFLVKKKIVIFTMGGG